MKRIHIIGMGPRTGTTLIAETMKACFDIDYATDHEDRLYSRPRHDCNVFLTKHPQDMFVVGPSLKVDPHLWIICMVRDPRDSVVSRHKKGKKKYWSNFRYWKTFYPIFQSLKSHPRFIPVIYEDFVSNPNETQKMLAERMAFLNQEHLFSEYHNVAQVSEESKKALLSVRPISPVGIGGWKNHLPRIKQQIENHGDISDELVYFGYEPDNKWLEILNDVEAYVGDSHHPEYFSTAELAKRKKKRYLEAIRRILSNYYLLPKRWPKKSQVEK